jgi:hypothetical protein
MAIEIILIVFVLFGVALLAYVLVFRSSAFMQIRKRLATAPTEHRVRGAGLKDNDPNRNRTWGSKN